MHRAGRLGAAAFDVLLLGIGGLVAYTAWGYGFGSLARPGPGLYPFFVGAAIAGFSAILLASHLKSAPRHEPFEKGQPSTLALMAAAFCFWILAMPLLGYVVVTAIAAFAFSKTMKLEGWRKPLALSCGTALFIHLLFDKWLYIDLPRGIFGN